MKKKSSWKLKKKGSSYNHVLGLYGHVQIFGLECRIHISLVPCLPLLAKCFGPHNSFLNVNLTTFDRSVVQFMRNFVTII
jgi:hypothetical protein